MLTNDVGTTIRQRREQLGWSQAALAQFVGVHPNDVDQWEWGEGAPDSEQAMRVGAALGIDLDAPQPEIVIDLVAPDAAAPSPGALPPPSVQLRDAWSKIKERVTGPRTEAPEQRTTPSRLSTSDRVSPFLLAGLVVAVVAAVAVAFAMGSGSREGEIGTLEQQVDDLTASQQQLTTTVSELRADVAAEAERADTAREVAEAEVAPVYTRNQELVDENAALADENEFLRKGIVISEASSEIDLVALTIDDGGTQQANEAVLDILADKGVTATLFPSGDNINAMPAVWSRAVADGHELGNHTLTHAGVRDLTRSELRQELKGWQEAIDTALGEPYETRWFRPPFMLGFEDLVGPERARDVLADRGMITALWDVETFYALFSDFGPQLAGPNPDADDVRRHVVNSASAGSIVLLHFGPLDIAALPGIIDGLREKGLEPVSLTTLMNAQTELLGAAVAEETDEPAA